LINGRSLLWTKSFLNNTERRTVFPPQLSFLLIIMHLTLTSSISFVSVAGRICRLINRQFLLIILSNSPLFPSANSSLKEMCQFLQSLEALELLSADF